MVVLGALVLAAPAANAQRAQRPTFTLGSPASAVRLAQGTPDLIERYTSLGVEIWSYGRTTVRLSADSGRVIGWDNRAGGLRIAAPVLPNDSTGSTFDIGSDRGDVARLQGAPTVVRRDAALGAEYWMYGRSVVRFGLGDMVVTGWWNAGNLRVLPAADSTARAAWLASSPAARRAGGERWGRRAGAGGRSAPAPSAPATLDA
ncbi:MAG TPA: hypothetical protein VFM58_03225, partial [Solirubrobacteraceae bacterium]|nr:hypothetical protein [Solirubrobacteraceae bacterium]